jgi:glycosyltransferase involved in cell wall biosynthesis
MTPAPRIRVIYLSHTLWIGGAEEMVLNLVNHLPRDRFDPMVCCIGGRGPIGEEIAAGGTPVIALDADPGLRRPFDVLRISRYLRRARPDIVHTFMLTASLYGRLAAVLARVPIIVGTEVNTYLDKRQHHIFAERLLGAVTDHIVTSANSVKEYYVNQIGVDPNRVGVIHNAVDFGQLDTTATRHELRARLGLPADVLVAGVIARLTDQKGHAYLLEAFASHPALATMHLLIVGAGPLRGDLDALTRAHGLDDRVHFVGARRDLGDLLSVMDIFVLPSLWEGLPLAMVLAMGGGLPVVATAVAGIPEVVTDEVTGLLVAPADAAALGRALARLGASRAERERLGAAGRAYVLPRFGVDVYVRAMSSLYEELLAARAAA